MLVSRRAQPIHNSRRGSALIASLVVVLVISSMGAVLIQLHSSITRRAAQSVDTKRALYMAEAGLSEAYLAVAQGKSGNVGSVAQPAVFGDGIYWVEASEETDGRVTLDATGLAGSGRIALSMVLQRTVNDLGSLGVFAEDGVTIEVGSLIDGFDGDKGDFDSQVSDAEERALILEPAPAEDTTGDGARIACNGDIVIEGSALSPPGESVTKIYGDVVPGPGASAVIDPGVLISGTTRPGAATFGLPDFDIPTGIPSVGDITYTNAGVPLVLGARKFSYDTLEIATGCSAVIEGPTSILIDKFILNSGAKLFLDTTNGGISLYITDYLKLDANSTVYSPTERAASVTILIANLPEIDRNRDGRVDPAVDIKCNGNLHGMIYAPHNEVRVPGSLRIYGTVMAQRLVLGRGARLTYDNAVARGAVAVESLPQLMSWRVTDLPDVPLVNIKIDPRNILEQQGITPIRSADAHKETDVEFNYLDTSGDLLTYNGAASAFNWANMDSMVSVDWIDPDTGLKVVTNTDSQLPATKTMPVTAISTL